MLRLLSEQCREVRKQRTKPQEFCSLYAPGQGLVAASPGALAAPLGGGADIPPPAGLSDGGGLEGDGGAEGGADSGGGVPPVSAPAGADLPASLQPVNTTSASMAIVSPNKLNALGNQDAVTAAWGDCALILCCGWSVCEYVFMA